MSRMQVGKAAIKKVNKAVGRIRKPISAVDLFCGVGGLTHGLTRGGVRVAAGIDLDTDCKYPFESNNNTVFLERDIRKLDSAELSPLFPENAYRLLAGCAPCQPFSTYSQNSRAKRPDAKWDLLLDFGRLVKELQPEFVTMENVPQLVGHNVFKKFLTYLEGYYFTYKIVNCVEYGIPQTRKRLVFLASKLGEINLVPATYFGGQPSTLRSAISKLPRIAAGESDPNDPLHTACSLSELNLKRIKASTPGGTWRDWPSKLRAKCHKRQTGETYPSVYGRMKWDAPSPTITTQCFGYGNGRFGHPEQDRAISLREAAIIQSFPEDYRFVPEGGHVRFSVLGRLIGNAVPVELGRVVAESLIQHVRRVEQNALEEQG